ncbi:hypothetical protein Ade02nite_82150 [Paractinoplanes deccanensis]|uniref:Uncharacterized protein n=1 Tax=Paractinoplanes deccanensis TaxID=113561 RepID=A0ABQ3YHS9_9ACTN|nr:hypothetical protein [Actinoplanes deccanensis]GID79574.1 hypothetical protein Ade02nite_82150 [Actinoplanes deccanensis]
MKGQIVRSPEGEEIELADIGLVEIFDNPVVRVWDVSLLPGETHPWHLHHNPYVVLSVSGSECRMDWLDGSPPRFLNEYHGGSVYRPVSPVHRLTNIGDRFYQNRLVELKELGELRDTPYPVGEGARSIQGSPPGPPAPDGRLPVLAHEHVRVWTIALPAGASRVLELTGMPHVIAELSPPLGVSYHEGGPLKLRNDSAAERSWFVVELAYGSVVRPA